MQEITKPDPKKFGTRTRTVLSQHPYKLDTNVHQSIHQKRHWKLNRRRVTRSVVHRALLLRGRQDERALILFNLRLASYSAAAWKKRVLTPLVRSAIRPRRERLKNLAATRTMARKRAAASAPYIAVANGYCSRAPSKLEVVEAPQTFIHLLLESTAAP